ncbi:F-box/kelch-repeat protein At5g26960 [Magnolia sinica]|uniref:F-box/kelch-repeat protein At5g26960 n=1 Tax=Magnolia sinica TaxID=86752 RepID=UPI00265A879D|nr:F-box/kelch-repeat protein At5g26960 [Magnolia sinica]
MEDASCNPRSLSWLVKSCIPNPHTDTRRKTILLPRLSDNSTPENRPENHPIPHNLTSFSSLPDDLLIETLSRVSPSSLPSVSLVCRRWAHALDSPAFHDLRRTHGRIQHTLYAVAVSDFGVLSATHRIGSDTSWTTAPFPGIESLPPEIFDVSFSHMRMLALGRSIYVVGRNATVRYDTWTGSATPGAPMLFPRKKFAAAAVGGRIYAAGGAACTASVEEYDPGSDTWRVVAEAPRRRYGCVGAAVDGIFYVIGGLRIGAPRGGRMEAHVYASSMDLYDVEAGAWLRSRHVPGGGCVVGACGAGGYVYVLASHAVELSFWRWDGKRGSAGFGEWCRLKSPPLPAQVRLDSAVRFSCVGIGERVALIQVFGCIDDLLRRSGRSCRGLKEGLVLVYDSGPGEWSRGPDLPEMFRRAACVCVEC